MRITKGDPGEAKAGASVWRTTLSIFMTALLLAAIVPVQANDSSNAPGISNSSETYIIVFNDASRHMVQAQSTSDLIASCGGQVKYRYDIINGMAVTVPGGMVDRLKSMPGVEYVEKDRQVHAMLDQAVPLIGADQAWGEGYNGSGVRVAIIDTGVDAGHPDLNGSRVVEWVDYVNNRSKPYDDNGHGTHVSSILAGTGNASGGKYTGIAPGTSLLEAKVLNSTGGGTDSSVINAIQWAVAKKAQVISISFGGPHDSALNSAIDNAVASGVTVVVAAGNYGMYGSDTISSPGDDPNVITVGAVYKNDTLAEFSSRGPTTNGTIKPDVVNVGVYVVAANASGIKNPIGYPVAGTNGYYQGMSGTSMATPMTAGVIALMLEKDPGLSPVEVKSILTRTARPLNNTAPIPNNDWGWGRVQAKYAVDNVTLYNSSYVSDTIPGTFLPDQPVAVTVTMANTGPSNWTRANNITIRGSYDASRFGATSFSLPADTTVQEGQQYAWSFNLTAPAASGPYVLSYRMYNDSDPFGTLVNKSVRVNTTINPGTIQFNGSTYCVNKSAGVAAIRVDRVNGTDNAVTAGYSTRGGNATAGVDYVPANGTLAFAQDQDHAFINITLLNNGTYNGTRTVNLTLTNVTGGAIAGANSTVIAINDTILSFTYHLNKGWNMISVPFYMPNSSVENFFPPDVRSKLTDMWWYDQGSWVYYSGTDGYLNSFTHLTNVEPGKGYYVLLTDNATFTVNGTIGASGVPPAGPGWTLFGVSGMGSINSTTVYPGNLDMWYLENGTWYYYSGKDGYLSMFPRLTGLDPGKGYWVNYG